MKYILWSKSEFNLPEMIFHLRQILFSAKTPR